MRDAARAAVDWATQEAPSALLIPGTPVGADDWSLPGFGLPIGSGTPVGLAEAMGRWLLAGRPATAVGPGSALAEFRSVLVMGDGSAARSDKAPGHHHPQARAFDEAVLSALEAGDAARLAGLDLDLAARVGAAGGPAWVALARTVDSVGEATVNVAVDPYGVLYLVARWTVRWAVPA